MQSSAIELDRLCAAALAEDLFADPEPELRALCQRAPAALEAGALARWVERDLSGVVIPPEALGRGRLLAKSAGVLAGLEPFLHTFRLLDASFSFQAERVEGEALKAGVTVGRLSGNARALLVGERSALNFIQRLSGTATLTARFVALAAGRVRILDTRKTDPGWRRLQKAAVLAGGGQNHRMGLFDEVMLKDNHADYSQHRSEAPPERLARLVKVARSAHGPQVRITAEARDLEQAEAALLAGADVLLLDNFEAEDLSSVCARLRSKARMLGRAVELEASGGIRLDTLEAFARSGVDRISVGALTHSAPALDLSLELEPSEGA